MPLVHLPEQAEFKLLELFGFGAAADIGHRFSTRDDSSALVCTGQEVAAPNLPAGVRRMGCKNNE